MTSERKVDEQEARAECEKETFTLPRMASSRIASRRHCELDGSALSVGESPRKHGHAIRPGLSLRPEVLDAAGRLVEQPRHVPELAACLDGVGCALRSVYQGDRACESSFDASRERFRRTSGAVEPTRQHAAQTIEPAGRASQGRSRR